MKTSSPHLFDLIKSLTTGEKRHFHRYAHQHRIASPDYFCFYEVLEKMQTWDNEVLINAFEHAEFKDHLPVLKHQLYERLLDALDQLHRRRDPEEQIKQWLHESYLLLKRGMTQASEIRVKKARKKLIKEELYHLYPALLKLETMLAEREIRRPDGKFKPEELQADSLANFELLREQTDAAQLKLTTYARHYKNLSIPNGLSAQAATATTLTARADQLQTQALLAFINRDTVTARALNEELLTTLQQLSPSIKTVPERYLSSFYNLLLDQLQLGEYDALEIRLEELKKLPTKTGFKELRGIKARVFEWSYQLELNSLLQQGKFKKALVLLPSLQRGLSSYQASLSGPGFASLHLLGGLTASLNHDHLLAIDFLLPLHQEIHPRTAKDIYRHGHYLYLMCQYSATNYDLVENLLENSLRRLKQQPDVSPAEIDFLSRLRKLNLQPENKKAILEEWLSAHDRGGNLERYLYLSLWLTSG